MDDRSPEELRTFLSRFLATSLLAQVPDEKLPVLTEALEGKDTNAIVDALAKALPLKQAVRRSFDDLRNTLSVE